MQISDIPTGWLLLDIERKKKEDGKWKLSEIALIDSRENYHNRNLKTSASGLIFQKIVDARIILGHNIRRHDLPKLYKSVGKQLPSSLDIKICDTLELSALGQPHTFLNKKKRYILTSTKVGGNNRRIEDI
ncbi:MAG: hypothetical protein ACK5AW_17740 [Pseudanabaena sp.]|jgi:hypothetical protein